MPLVADGVLYYTGSYSRIFALDGATGKVLWSYSSRTRRRAGRAADPLALQPRHSRWAKARLFVGTVDGRLFALDMKTGKPVWETKLIDARS